MSAMTYKVDHQIVCQVVRCSTTLLMLQSGLSDICLWFKVIQIMKSISPLLLKYGNTNGTLHVEGLLLKNIRKDWRAVNKILPKLKIINIMVSHADMSLGPVQQTPTVAETAMNVRPQLKPCGHSEHKTWAISAFYIICLCGNCTLRFSCRQLKKNAQKREMTVSYIQPEYLSRQTARGRQMHPVSRCQKRDR